MAKGKNKKSNYYEEKGKGRDKTLNKDRIRKIIIEEIRKRDIKSIVTLESPDFKFSRLLPDKKIIVFEKEGDVCEELEKKAPKNVEVVFGNINRFEIFNSKADFIYLDFCKTWATEEENVVKLIESLKKTKLFGITLCLRETKWHKDNGFTYSGDYQFDLIKRLQFYLIGLLSF